MKHFGGLVVIQSVSWVWRTTRELNWKQYPKLVKVRWMFYSLMTIFVSPSPCPRVNHKSRFTRTQRIFFFSLISPPKGVVDSGETCFSCAPGFSYWFFLWLWAVSSQFSHQCNSPPHTLTATWNSAKDFQKHRKVSFPSSYTLKFQNNTFIYMVVQWAEKITDSQVNLTKGLCMCIWQFSIFVFWFRILNSFTLKATDGEDSWESLGLQGDPTSPFWRRSALGFLWKEWC